MVKRYDLSGTTTVVAIDPTKGCGRVVRSGSLKDIFDGVGRELEPGRYLFCSLKKELPINEIIDEDRVLYLETVSPKVVVKSRDQESIYVY